MGYGGRGVIDTADEAVPMYQNLGGDARNRTPIVEAVTIVADESNTGGILFAPFKDANATSGSRMGHRILQPGETMVLSGSVDLLDWWCISDTAECGFRWWIAADVTERE